MEGSKMLLKKVINKKSYKVIYNILKNNIKIKNINREYKMVEYECKICEYKTSILTHYNKHLNTKKHKKNEEKYGVKPLDQVKIEQKTDKKRTFGEKKGQKTDTKRTFSSKKVIHVCKYCDKEFSSRQTLLRHEKKYCKQKEDLTSKLDLQADGR